MTVATATHVRTQNAEDLKTCTGVTPPTQVKPTKAVAKKKYKKRVLTPGKKDLSMSKEGSSRKEKKPKKSPSKLEKKTSKIEKQHSAIKPKRRLNDTIPQKKATVSTASEEFDSSVNDFNIVLCKSKDARLAWLMRVLEKGVGYLLRRYRDNIRYKSTTATTLVSNANLAKNRYDDIRCIDATRVILKGWSSDYIHANWIVMADGRRFICSQAPMESTIGDFWHMIIQENCRTIIMLCNFVEDDKEKCAKYFPQSKESSVTFGSTKVTLVEQSVSEHGYTTSNWKVQNRDRQFTLRHLHCTTWPDHSAPQSTLEVIALHKEISKSPRENPIIIHCSAGIGRTCTLMGIELLLERIHHRRDASGVAVMRWLRDRRLGAIQKSIQFVFMHYAIIQLLCQEGVMKADNPKVIAFQEKYEKLLAKHTQTRKKAEKMLDVLQTQLDDDELLKQSDQKGSTLEKEDDDKKIAEDKQGCVNLQLEPDLYGDTNTGDKKEVHSSEYLELL
ncbi:hypothetical protein RB195_002131 [Necator americanus]|uniref:Protein-tyrosine phosphatase n=1 Tax=Necator americanus TaxID=51031 RepID=A0ABR1DI16_NECAM